MIQVIEFMGMPKTGLDTAVKYAAHCLRKNGFSVRVHNAGKEKYFKKEAVGMPNFNAISSESVISTLLDFYGKIGTKDRKDFLLINRGLLDHIVFEGALRDAGETTPERSEQRTKYIESFLSLENAAVILGMDDETAMNMERLNIKFSENVVKIYGSVTNPKFLNHLKFSYMDVFDRYIKNGFRRLLVDGMSNPYEKNNRIMDFLCRGIAEKAA